MEAGSTALSCKLTTTDIYLASSYTDPQALDVFYHCSKDFTAYTDVCFREFGNHVKFWTTINEANIFTIGGYNDGITPPGRCSGNCMSGNSSPEPYIVGHNLLLAHASASRLYRQKYKVDLLIHVAM